VDLAAVEDPKMNRRRIYGEDLWRKERARKDAIELDVTQPGHVA